jgi:hypothetical protein
MIEAFEQLEINPPTPWYKKISVPMYVIIFLGILVVQIVVLYAMGRQFICNCGVIKFWEGDVMSSSNSQQIADWYTFSHIIHGFVFYGFFVWVSRRFFKKIGGPGHDLFDVGVGQVVTQIHQNLRFFAQKLAKRIRSTPIGDNHGVKIRFIRLILDKHGPVFGQGGIDFR